MTDEAVPAFRLGAPARRWMALAALLLVGVVVVIGIRVAHTTGPLKVDRLGSRVVDSRRVAGELARHHLARLDSRRMFHRLVWLGSPRFVGVAAVALGLWRVARRDALGAALAVITPVLAGALTEFVAKPIIGRRLHGGLAFPSGHVTAATALAGVAVAMAVRQWGHRATWVVVPAALVPLGVSAGVVRAGFHYVTDAIGGIAMGTAAVLLGVVIVSAVEDRRRARPESPLKVGAP